MRNLLPVLALPLALPLLGGCISTAASIVKAPFEVVGKAADVMTTSQSEADEKRGRAMRKQEEELGKLMRKRDKLARTCQKDDGDDGKEACAELDDVEDEIEKVRSRKV
jgi:hypothetical protein